MQTLERVARSNMTRDGLVELLADLAGLATPEDASTALPDVLGRMTEQTGAAACQLDTATTSTQQAEHAHFQTVVNVGYPDAVSRHLGGEFLSSHHGQLVIAADTGLRIGEDDPYDFRGSTHFHDVLEPAGFDDGMSLALRDSAQDLVGVLHLSACSARDFRPDVAATLHVVGRALARVTQLASCSTPDVTLPRDFAAARLDARGVATPVLGREPLHLDLDADLRAIVQSILATGTQFATFLHQQQGRLVEVRLHAPGTARSPRRACTIATRPAGSTLGLTLRQLEVLTAVATGAGNREIAEELCLTQRTVAAHLEAILTRLNTPTRAGAAATATAAGILLPSPLPGSVRSIATILRGPAA
jgi:DNA-binding CsgD family transcriptional regulator